MRWSAVAAVALAGVMGGALLFGRSLRSARVGASPHARPASAAVDLTDSYGDGTPDFLRLSSEADRQAFRRWFTFLAESQYFHPSQPDEIGDCAALLRFAYREALRRHSGVWAAALALPAPPAIPAVAQYEFPHTPLGASAFRVREGRFTAASLGDGAFAEFADANTLRRLNTYFVSRDLRVAQPGDLLFFRQTGQNSPYHAMIFLGRRQLQPGAENYIVYHTGPIGNRPGEIRRPAAPQLLAHPEARWHPVPGNPAFLGIYRWNILRGAD